jgi:putative salt-induced outer membrane protein YdiY
MHLAKVCFQLALVLLAAGPAAHSQDVEGPGVLPPPSWAEAPLDAPPAAADQFEQLLPPPVEQAAGESLAANAVEDLAAAITPTPFWYEPAYWFGPDPWDAGVELGINGSQGNNDVFSMRAGGHLKRVTPRWKLDSSLLYNKNHTNSIETQNNAKHDLRLDRILDNSPWTLFVLENMIYDEFQAYDLQLSLNTGVGYQWLKTPATDFLTRFGAGATREFGGVDNQWKPQALFGLDLTHQLSKTQRLTAKVDYYPEWEEFRNYRVVTDLGWQVDLDRPKNVSLKASVIDRYDSTPNGREANNLDYAVVLIWKL